MTPPVLSLRDLTVRYTTRQGEVSAVEGVSFDLYEGEVLGLVGESGCGKTTIALALLKLLPENGNISEGSVYVGGVDLVPLGEDAMRAYRWQRVSMVFQSAMNALNPVYPISAQILEAIRAHQGEAIDSQQARQRVSDLFHIVGLDDALIDRYPHQYSGGMRQRAFIAMALACDPDIIIADEPTTALDVLVQDQVLRRLRKIQEERGIAMLYISHDIAVIAEMSDRVGIIYAGKLVELADVIDIFKRPLHPYSYALMRAVPSVGGDKRQLQSLPGEPPDLLRPPDGCRFHPRCTYATDICRRQTPQLEEHNEGHSVACWHPVKTS